MKAKEDDSKISKAQKNIEGVRREVKNILKSSNLLPYLNSPNLQLELFLPSNPANQQVRLLLQDNHKKHVKISRHFRSCSVGSENNSSIINDCRLTRRSLANEEPLFFNRAAGRYETSAQLSRYEHELVENGAVKVARRSSKLLLKKKIISMLPEIPKMPQKIKALIDEQSPRRKVTMTIDSRQIPLSEKYSKTIEHEDAFEKRRKRQIRHQTLLLRAEQPKCIMSSYNSASLEQKNEEQIYEPWPAEEDYPDDLLS